MRIGEDRALSVSEVQSSIGFEQLDGIEGALHISRFKSACLHMKSTGIHSGPVTSGIVGKIRRRFCVFGDTVNMASRTETSCPPGCIQVW